MSDCRFCAIVSKGAGHALMCVPCYMGHTWLQPAPAPAAVRRSQRLAAKPAVNYYEAPVPSEAAIRLQEQLKVERGQMRMVRNALRVQARCEAAIAHHQAVMKRRTERIIARMERDAAVLAAMPATPPRLQRHNAVTDAPWAPPHPPALSRTEATGCALHEEEHGLPPPPPLRRTCQLPGCDEWCSYCLGNDRIQATGGTLSPPPPLRRTCQLPGCNEWCTYCRENDRIAAANRSWNPLMEPRPVFVPQLSFGGAPPSSSADRGLGGDLHPPPPPIGATVVRIPVDLRLMTAAALRELIAAANAALSNP